MSKKPHEKAPADIVEIARALWGLKKDAPAAFDVATYVIWSLGAAEYVWRDIEKRKPKAKKKAARRG